MNYKKKLFNPEADDSIGLRKIFGGSTSNINNFNEVKYKWTNPLYREMTANYWIPEIISLSKDKVQYRELEIEEKEAYDETLSFLVFLDSIQSTSLPSIGDYITAPEVYRLVALQTFQEVIHSQAYSYILESICDAREIHSIYYRFKDDEKLNERCQQMTGLYSKFRDDPTDENLAILIISIYMLEGLLFFNGFYFFYALAYNGKMTKSADEIRLIQR